MLAPRDVTTGFEGWPALDELFVLSFQGVNPNRGLEGSVIDVDHEVLRRRMTDYFSAEKFGEVRDKYPVLCERRARYDPEGVWRCLRKDSQFHDGRIVPYLLFPFDQRWIYYEVEAKLLNERRPEFWQNLDDNEFLVVVPQPRRVSETRPLLSRTLVDLHVHDRGSVCFPAMVKSLASGGGPLFEEGKSSLRPTSRHQLGRCSNELGDFAAT